jgi:broad specificity phosphatase PhoE
VTALLFLRHAETAMSDRLEWHGNADPPLSPRGKAHALRAARALVALDVGPATIWTSDYRRATETAAAFGKVLRCPVVRDANLRERDLGDWTGLSLGEIEAGWPGRLEAWKRRRIPGPPGGETDREVAARVSRALLSYPADDPGSMRLIIAHAGLLRGLLAANQMADEEIPPLSGRWLTMLPRGRLAIGETASF